MADPAYHGYVETALDALIIIQGCSSGVLPLVTRRLQDAEKKRTVISGSVFVWDEQATGIKRWTDGISWSPSRTLGNFLVYRELDKRAKTTKSPKDGPTSSRGGAMAENSMTRDSRNIDAMEKIKEKALVGSLTSSYRFRKAGLVKKTISLGGLHLIGYYTMDDVLEGLLETPSSHPALSALNIHPRLLDPIGFRVPLQTEVGDDGVLRYVGETETLPDTPLGSESANPSGTPLTDLMMSYSRGTTSDAESVRMSPLIPTLPSMNPYLALRDDLRTTSRAVQRSNGNRYDPYTMSRSPSLSSSTFASHTPHASPPMHPPNGYASFSAAREESNYDRPAEQERYGRHYFADRVRPSSSGGLPVVTGPRQWQRGSQVLVRGQSEQGISTSYAEFQAPYPIAYGHYDGMDRDDRRDSQANRPLLPPINVAIPQQSHQVFAYEPPALADSTNAAVPTPQSYAPSYPIATPRLSHDVDSYSAAKFDVPTYYTRPSAIPPLSTASDARSYSLDSAMYSPPSNIPPVPRRASSSQQPRHAQYDAYQALGQASYPTYVDSKQGGTTQSHTLQQYEDAYEYSDRSNRESNGGGMMEHSPELARAQLRQRQEDDESVAMRRRLSEREERQIVTEESRHQQQTRQANW